ncbi:hypothetical protein [Promicromonospora sp. NPDC050880]|uniref:hypothetical protein n=1 Tax=Promicromonospora sp. NPDC050880 TaxID=3364406 RepID=UPI003795CEDF
MPAKEPVPTSLLHLARQQCGLLPSQQCDAAGVGPSRRRNLVARGGWRRVTRCVLDTGATPEGLHVYDIERRRAAWTALLANPRAIAVGCCALALHGVAGLPRRIVPEAALPRGTARKARDGIAFRQYATEQETVEIEGRTVVTVRRALVQALPTLSRDEAVACLDSALHQGLITPGDLRTIRRDLLRRRGSARVIPWLDRADGRAESPPESHARLRAEDAGFAPDDVQRDFFDVRGRFLGRADLAWHLGGDRWLVVEIDSQAFHGAERQVRRDALRQNDLVREGRNLVMRFFPGQVTGGDFAGDVARVLDREGWRPDQELPPRPTRRRPTARRR